MPKQSQNASLDFCSFAVLPNPIAVMKLKNLYIQAPLARLSYCETHSISQPYKKSFKCDAVLSLAFFDKHRGRAANSKESGRQENNISQQWKKHN